MKRPKRNHLYLLCAATTDKSISVAYIRHLWSRFSEGIVMPAVFFSRKTAKLAASPDFPIIVRVKVTLDGKITRVVRTGCQRTLGIGD